MKYYSIGFNAFGMLMKFLDGDKLNYRLELKMQRKCFLFIQGKLKVYCKEIKL
jgi:hypothetical protein